MYIRLFSGDMPFLSPFLAISIISLTKKMTFLARLPSLWSHKPGENDVINTDKNGDLIYNPKKANRGDYDIFV